MLNHHAHENFKFENKKYSIKCGLDLKYINCVATKAEVSESKLNGLVISNGNIKSVACFNTKIEHFIIADKSQISYSHFTNMLLCQSGAIVDTDIHNNIFNNVLFHNIHFAKSFFLKNSFIDCVFSNCMFYRTVFKDCSFSGTLFRNCVFKQEDNTSIAHMIKCDFKPESVLGPFKDIPDDYPTLNGYCVKDNLSVYNMYMSFKDCVGISGLLEMDKVPESFSSIKFNFTNWMS